MSIIFYILSALLGGMLSIVSFWPRFGSSAILIAPIGGAIGCLASAALLFALQHAPWNKAPKTPFSVAQEHSMSQRSDRAVHTADPL